MTSPDATRDATLGQAYDALIIGAGFAGMYQLHCLRDRLGLDVQVLEARLTVTGLGEVSK